MKELRGIEAYQKGDERILGGSEFVENALREAEEKLERKAHVKAKGIGFEHLVQRVAELSGLSAAEVLAGEKRRAAVVARGLLCYWATNELGLSQVWLAKKLRVSQPAVSSAVARGKEVVERNRYTITS